MSDDHLLRSNRSRIDVIDKQVVDLLQERARLVQEMGKLKPRLGLPFFSPPREMEINGRFSENVASDFPQQALKAVFREIISACRSLQTNLQVLVFGKRHGMAYSAAVACLGSSMRLTCSTNLKRLFSENDSSLFFLPWNFPICGLNRDFLSVFRQKKLSVILEIIVKQKRFFLCSKTPNIEFRKGLRGIFILPKVSQETAVSFFSSQEVTIKQVENLDSEPSTWVEIEFREITRVEQLVEKKFPGAVFLGFFPKQNLELPGTS